MMKFTKDATTDDIVNTDPDLIDIDSFQYVNKFDVCKALVYMFRNMPNLSSTETDDENTTSKDPFDQVSLINIISNKFAEFKSEILSNVNESIDKKLEPILGEINSSTKSCDIISTVNSAIDNKLSTISPTEPNDISPNNITWASKVCLPEPAQSFANKSNVSDVTVNQNSLHSHMTEAFEVLVLTPDTSCSHEAVNNVKKAINNKLKNVQVEFVKSNDQSGKISLGFRNASTRDEVDKILNQDEHLSSLGYGSKVAHKMLPKITLNDVSNDILDYINTTNISTDKIRELEKKKIIELILEKNPCVAELVLAGHTLQVVYLSRGKVGRNNLTIGLKLSPAIRAAILEKQRGSIYLESGSYQFKERFHKTQCYQCQLLGHSSDSCPDKCNDPVCLYCMSNHKSKDCQWKKVYSKHRCAKCHASNNPNDKANYATHNSASPNCPVLVREYQQLAKVTDFTSKNVM